MPLAVAIGAGGALNWVHGHHLGTPIVTTNASGQVVTSSGYAVTGFPGQFANALQLAGAQHFYNRHRDYDPTTGRYIQADPIGLDGDPNPYAYARGNALRYMDPSGEFAPIAIAGVCALGGCEAAAGLLAAGLIWYATHPIILPENSSPIPIPSSGSDCPAKPNNKDSCQAGWEEESQGYCVRKFKGQFRQRCQRRARDRLSACIREGGPWPPNGPDRWSLLVEYGFRP